MQQGLTLRVNVGAICTSVYYDEINDGSWRKKATAYAVEQPNKPIAHRAMYQTNPKQANVKEIISRDGMNRSVGS